MLKKGIIFQPKQTKEYLDELLGNANKSTKNKIHELYNEWKTEKSTSHFDYFWLEVNRSISRSRLRVFNGTSFEEHVYESIRDRYPNLEGTCFWGLDQDPIKRRKVRLSLFRGLKHKFDIAIYETNRNPTCLIECKTFPNYIEILGLAALSELPVFNQTNVFYVTHLITAWDLRNGLREFISERTSGIRNFHFFKIGSLIWTPNQAQLATVKTKLDQTEEFLRRIKA